MRGQEYALKDIIAVSAISTDQGNVIGFRVAHEEDNADDHGVGPGQQGYAELNALRLKYYELAGVSEKQQLLYDIICEALIQRVSLSPEMLRILINHIGVKSWECQRLIEPLTGWARMLQFPDSDVREIVFTLDMVV